MSDSPFAAYANTILRFEVPSGELTTVPGNGNIKPAGTAVVQVTAMLLQARPPADTTRPGVDSTAVYLEGFAVEPMAVPSIVTPQSPCAATWNGRRGKFLLELTGRSPFGYEDSTGDEIKGWFQVLSFAVEGDLYVPPPPPPPPTPIGDLIAYTHTQTTPSLVWVIQHNLNREPSITTSTTTNSVIDGDITYSSSNVAIVTFSVPLTGQAYCI